MMLRLFLFFLLCFVAWYIVSDIFYRKTNYYQVTHKSFAAVKFNKGNYGEFLTYKYLRQYENDGAKFLFNCYLPKGNNQTTEIDVLMIHSSGVFVFESKNYSGWIFGAEYQKNWTQTLPNGRKARKEHFLNPIMQNKLHIKWLQNQIGEDVPIHSVIVFSERCTLKKVDITSSNIYVVKRNRVRHAVADIIGRKGTCIEQSTVTNIYDKLYGFSQVSDDVKKKHIQEIMDTHMSDESKGGTIETDTSVCPKCGGTLVLRTSIRGTYAGSQFWGCSNYPKCKYIKNI